MKPRLPLLFFPTWSSGWTGPARRRRACWRAVSYCLAEDEEILHGERSRNAIDTSIELRRSQTHPRSGQFRADCRPAQPDTFRSGSGTVGLVERRNRAGKGPHPGQLAGSRSGALRCEDLISTLRLSLTTEHRWGIRRTCQTPRPVSYASSRDIAPMWEEVTTRSVIFNQLVEYRASHAGFRPDKFRVLQSPKFEKFGSEAGVKHQFWTFSSAPPRNFPLKIKGFHDFSSKISYQPFFLPVTSLY